jgi:hypothetical protein
LGARVSEALIEIKGVDLAYATQAGPLQVLDGFSLLALGGCSLLRFVLWSS